MFDFSKVTSGFVTKDFVLSKVSDSQIFYNYFGKFDLKKAYNSPFRKDRNPSCSFYIGKNGDLKFGDFATGERLDCFGYVGKLYNLNYYNSLLKIAADFGLIYSPNHKIVSKKILFEGAQIDRDCKTKTIIQFKPDKWKDEHISYWNKYEVTKEELIANNVFPVKELYINKKKIWNRTNCLRFAYLVKHEGQEYVKIYSPNDKYMKWVSNIPLNIPFGLEDLPIEDDILIITKSQKDRIVLKKLFNSVIATQNESESALPSNIVSLLNDKHHFNRKIIFWDNDSTGVDNCTKFNTKGFGYFNIPKEYYKKYKIKDASDYVLYFGIDALHELFKEKNILC